MGPQSRYSGDCTRRLRMDTGSSWSDWSTRVFAGVIFTTNELNHRLI